MNMGERPSIRTAHRAIAIAAVCLCCAIVGVQAGFVVHASEAAAIPGEAENGLPKPLPFIVDVWTNKGGQGSGEYGGDFAVGEEVVVYLGATWDCLASIMVAPVGGSPYALMDGQLVAGETYEFPPLEQLGSSHTGSWEVVVSAISGETQSADSVVFTVGDAPVPLTPDPVVVAVGPDQATELDALVAAKMATGAIAPDLSLDVNRDGQVTLDDARLILTWAVQ